MIAALCWKEWREHWAVWLTMSAGSGLALVGVYQLADKSPERNAALIAVAILLNWVYGLVCGGMLLAGEREDGTLPFLDALPALRGQLWSIKCLAGAGLVLGQALVLASMLAAFPVGGPGLLSAVALGVAAAGLIGLAWGLLFSAAGSSVLQVIGQGLGAQILAALALGVVIFFAQVVSLTLFSDPIVILLLLALGEAGLTGLACFGSRRVFCRPDRLRRRDGPWNAADDVQPRHALRWLLWRQARLFLLVLPLFALLLGFLALANGTVLWPAGTLLLGLACGVTVFGDEQASGAFRFLGDQRLPPGRVWLAKVGLRLALALGADLLALLPSLIRVANQQNLFLAPRTLTNHLFNDLFLAELVPLDTVLLLGVLHGFAVGQLCSLLFRKTLVAAVLGLGGSVLAVSVWLPSLAGGGLHVWQTLAVPLACLLASRLLLPAWSAGCLTSRGALGRLGACALLAAAGTTLMLFYRVAQAPDLPQQLDLASYAASLPPPEHNRAGQRVRNANESLAMRLEALKGERPARPLFADNRPPAGTAGRARLVADVWSFGLQAQLRQSLAAGPVPYVLALAESTIGIRLPSAVEGYFANQLEEVLARGWPGGEPELAGWLDKVCSDPWYRQLHAAAELPVGMVEDPRRLHMFSRLRSTDAALMAARLLVVQGLRRQAQGDGAAFVGELKAGFALAANLDNHAVAVLASVARSARSELLRGLDRWLERLDGQPELLGTVLQQLRRHEEQMPSDYSDTLKAELLVLHNTVEDLAGAVSGINVKAPRETVALWAAALTLAQQTPWERERQRRLLVLAEYNLPRGPAALPLEDWYGRNFTPRGRHRGEQSWRRGLARLRAAQVVVALRLYQARKHRPAAALAALVPDYLPAVPLDPFDGQPLRYRLSAGEDLAWPPDPALPWGGSGMRRVPAGQGIVWSVGADGADGHGQKQAGSGLPSATDEDLIFLVPLPRSKGPG
jgi:hypothetical protein